MIQNIAWHPTMWDSPWTIVEMPSFTRKVNECFASEDDYREFQSKLLVDPQAGAVIPGCGGWRKVRWADKHRAKGKRGGLRIIYILIENVLVMVMGDVYDKNDMEDLTSEQKHTLAKLARTLKEEIAARTPRRRSE